MPTEHTGPICPSCNHRHPCLAARVEELTVENERLRGVCTEWQDEVVAMERAIDYDSCEGIGHVKFIERERARVAGLEAERDAAEKVARECKQQYHDRRDALVETAAHRDALRDALEGVRAIVNRCDENAGEARTGDDVNDLYVLRIMDEATAARALIDAALAHMEVTR